MRKGMFTYYYNRCARFCAGFFYTTKEQTSCQA